LCSFETRLRVGILLGVHSAASPTLLESSLLPLPFFCICCGPKTIPPFGALAATIFPGDFFTQAPFVFVLEVSVRRIGCIQVPFLFFFDLLNLPCFFQKGPLFVLRTSFWVAQAFSRSRLPCPREVLVNYILFFFFRSSPLWSYRLHFPRLPLPPAFARTPHGPLCLVFPNLFFATRSIVFLCSLLLLLSLFDTRSSRFFLSLPALSIVKILFLVPSPFLFLCFSFGFVSPPCLPPPPNSKLFPRGPIVAVFLPGCCLTRFSLLVFFHMANNCGRPRPQEPFFFFGPPPSFPSPLMHSFAPRWLCFFFFSLQWTHFLFLLRYTWQVLCFSTQRLLSRLFTRSPPCGLSVSFPSPVHKDL